MKENINKIILVLKGLCDNNRLSVYEYTELKALLESIELSSLNKDILNETLSKHNKELLEQISFFQLKLEELIAKSIKE